MGYWGDRDADGPPKSEGWHLFRVTRVITAGKDGKRFTSKGGDPQALVVLEDEQGAEGTIRFTFSNKAAWTIARFLSRAGLNLDEFEAKYPDAGSIVGREEVVFGKASVYGYAEKKLQGGRMVSNVEAFHEEEVPVEALERIKRASSVGVKPASEVDDDDVPF